MTEPVLERPLGLKNIPDYLRASQMKSENEFPYSGIWVFTGGQGTGKTLQLMHTLKAMHDEYPDALIISNISIFGVPCIPYEGLEDFERYYNGQKGIIYVLDEIQTLFNSIESRNMPSSSLAIWSQNRKNRRVILGTSQRFSRIAKGLREQTRYNIECRSSLFFFYRYRVLDGYKYDDDGNYQLDDDEKMPSWNWFVPKFSVMSMYNTLEVVKNSSVSDLDTLNLTDDFSIENDLIKGVYPWF